MHSRKTIYALLSNRSDLCLKQFIIKSGSSLLTHMQTGLWRIGKGYSGQMKQKSTELGQMARCIPGNLGVNQSLIGQPHQLSSMEEAITLWYGGVWAGMVWGHLWRLWGR